MFFRRFLAQTIAVTALAAAGPTFIPDARFQGSNLTGWHTLGAAEWRAANGEITGKPTAVSGGWLLMDRGLQDLGVYASFRCLGECATGLLVRAQKTPDGIKGLLVSLT